MGHDQNVVHFEHMKVLIVTPLYPPDIAPLAQYVKELGTRLREHMEVTIVAYGQFPEKIDEVTIHPVTKNALLPFRLASLFCRLWVISKKVDCIYLQNGASVELPVFFLSFITRTRIIFRLGDPVALSNSKKRFPLRVLLTSLMKRVSHVVVHDVGDKPLIPVPVPMSVVKTPNLRPEILPFTPYPTAELVVYEDLWKSHLTDLIEIFHHDGN